MLIGGEGAALRLEDGSVIDRAALRTEVAAFAAQLGGGGRRLLVLIEAANDRATIVAYLACLEAGHPVIMAGAENVRLIETFEPDVVVRAGQIWSRPQAAREFHPDLAVLLSTSGSTGSPKLVRLSRGNIVANARSIAEYLAISPEDRAITSLPIHYSYGLSVLNSHLLAGASLVLTDCSVTDPDFWALFRQSQATSIAGVPYSYELFERTGLRDDPPPSLKVMTQAGGRLPPELVSRYADFAARHGIRFYVMYGQTEATARMAYLPPEYLATDPDAIGVAIPGGSFSLREGELIYRGPNVMMGYAFSAADLARGPELDELATGDLARCDDKGLYRITGRASRFAKIAGLRIGFDDLETMLAAAGVSAAVGGDDQGIAICVTGGMDAGAVRDLVSERCHLPVTAVAVYEAGEVPRLPSGKVDFPAIRTEARRHAEADPELEHGAPVAAVFARVTGRRHVGPEDSFASLGGDSLSYVEASLGLERLLGNLPHGWETMTIAELEGLRSALPATAAPASRHLVRIESEVVLRVLAILLVIIGHAAPHGTEFLRGGSGILMMLAGYNLARFQSGNLAEGKVGITLGGTFFRVILPYLALMVVMLFMSKAERSLSWPLLLSTFAMPADSLHRGPLFAYWFIEAVFHALLIVCALFLLPPVRKLAASRPFLMALGLVGLGVALRFVAPLLWDHGSGIALTVDAWFYAYALGWGLRCATGRGQQFVMLALTVVVFFAVWGIDSARAWWPIGVAVLLIVVPTIMIPRLAAQPLKVVASDSYFIYLTHVLAVHVLVLKLHLSPSPWFNIPAVLAASLLLGLIYASSWRRFASPLILWGWNGFGGGSKSRTA